MNINTLLEGAETTGRVALIAQVALVECQPEASCLAYLAALDTALTDAPPPFDTSDYATTYHEAAQDPKWLAVSLMTNAEREGDGAKRLWSLAACTDTPDVCAQLKVHAVDESRHALLYLALLDLAFPGMVDPRFRAELGSLSPRYSMRQDLSPVPGSPYAKRATVDDFLQMNVAEIRTAIHHLLQRPALARHCPPARLSDAVAIQNSLLRDELKHVAYTAVLIERAVQEVPPDRTAELFRRRVGDFNRITIGELGASVFDCSLGCCERHPSCRAKAPVLVELNGH